MAPEAIGLLTVLGMVVVATLYSLTRRQVDFTDDERGLPASLRGARLVHAEQTFRSLARRLVARLDRAYEVAGELVLVEFKTRHADVAYMADVIELSVQRVALQDEMQVRVSRTAWVVVQNSDTGRRAPHRVMLLSTAEVEALRHRYLEVQAGAGRAAALARSANQCVHCAHRTACGRMADASRAAAVR
jgi:hypothetical protein